MSDSEHEVETFESADAGASHTVPMQAGSVRKGGFMVRARRPARDATASADGGFVIGRDARDADMTSVSVSADVGFIPEVCIYHLASGDMCDNFYRWLHASETSELAATRAT